MILVDTNILVYSLNTISPKYSQSQEFLRDHIDELVVAHQNILEAFRVLTHPKFPKPRSQKNVLQALESITKEIEIIHPRLETYYIILDLLKRYAIRGDQVFDIYLTATALSNGIEVIATDNEKDFKKFTEIKIINPFKS